MKLESRVTLSEGKSWLGRVMVEAPLDFWGRNKHVMNTRFRNFFMVRLEDCKLWSKFWFMILLVLKCDGGIGLVRGVLSSMIKMS